MYFQNFTILVHRTAIFEGVIYAKILGQGSLVEWTLSWTLFNEKILDPRPLYFQ